MTPPNYKYVCNHLVPIGKMVSTKIGSKCYHHNCWTPFLFQCHYHIWQGQKMFLSSKMLKLVLGPSQPPVVWVSVALSLAVVARARLTTHLYLVLMSRIGEATPSLPLYTFKVCTVTTVSLYWLYHT